MNKRHYARAWFHLSRAMGHTRRYSLGVAVKAYQLAEAMNDPDFDELAGTLHVASDYVETQRQAGVNQ